jgi:CheY-like chemotaxis protein
MPNMDGYEATMLIRQKNKDIPIIALTANAMKEDIQRTKEAGMNKHLNKPIEVEKLYATLLQYISKKVAANEEQTIKKDDITLPEFETFNKDEALKMVLNNKKIVLNTIKGLYEFKEIKLENLNDDELARTAHTIKGLSGSLVAKELQNIAKNIEESLDRSLFEKFYQEFKKVIDEIEQKLSFGEKIQKQELSQEKRDELFAKLKEAIKTKRVKNTKPIIEELDRYHLESEDKQLFEELKGLVKKFKFKEAIELMS